MSKDKYCKKYKKTHYYIPIFCRNINIVFKKKDFLYLAKKYQNFKYDRELSNGEAFYNPHNSEFMIGVFDDNMATLSHELVHLCIFILQDCHIDPLESDGETMAHLNRHLFELIQERAANGRDS